MKVSFIQGDNLATYKSLADHSGWSFVALPPVADGTYSQTSPDVYVPNVSYQPTHNLEFDADNKQVIELAQSTGCAIFENDIEANSKLIMALLAK